MSEPAKEVAPVTTPATPAPAVVPATETPATEVKAPEVKVEAAKEAASDKSPEKKPTDAVKVVPEKYELKAPEGSLLKQDELDQVAALAKERGLDNEGAQKLVDERSQLKGGFLADQQKEFSQIRAQWQQDWINDKEFGGEKAKENAEIAKRFVDRYADADVKKAFDDFGFGDHPGLVRMFAKAGKAMAEDKHVAEGKPSTSDLFEAKDVLYPSHKKTE